MMMLLYLQYSFIIIILLCYGYHRYNSYTIPNIILKINKLSVTIKSPTIIYHLFTTSEIINWNFQYFNINYGDKIVKITPPFYIYQGILPTYRTILFRDYIFLILNYQTQEYLKAEDDYQLLKEFKIEDKVLELFNSIKPTLSLEKLSFWMGPKNSITPLHYDYDYYNVLMILEGKKEIILIHPKYSKYLYEIEEYNIGSSWSQVDIWNIDIQKYPLLKHITYDKIILEKGESLYIPAFYWHSIRNIENSIAITYHYYTIYSILTIDIPNRLLHLIYKIKSLL